YKLTPKELQELNEFLDENLKKQYIQLLKSLMASSFFFIGKKDGKLQPCQDYQYLTCIPKRTCIPFPTLPLFSIN
ncbi:hypothetical protein AN958_10651, partial [Leucoagaricus sp. SymC.cos]